MDELKNAVAGVIDAYRLKPRISPAWVATEALLRIDPTGQCMAAYPAIYSGCHMHARQIARRLLIHLDEPNPESGDADLFGDELQWRYPAAHAATKEDEPEYVLLSAMSDADYEWNITRLERESGAKQRHADRLRGHWQRLRAAS